MSLKAPSFSSKQVLLAGFLLLCCSALFFIYYKPTMSWTSCSDTVFLKYDDCTEACQGSLKLENPPQILQNDTVNETVVLKETITTQSPQVEKEPAAQEPVSETLVLVWEWPFGQMFDLDACESNYGIKGCTLTIDRNQMDKAHGVMFHIRDIEDDLPYLKTVSRPQGQKWVWFNMESPTYTPHLPGAEDLFNLTTNFRRDSDIWVPHIQLLEASEEQINSFKIPEKDKLVCWIVSHWEDQLRRTGYFNELSKHINVEAYGDHFGRHVNDADFGKIMSGCKFYLSFENSIHRDYITEKVFNPMSVGTVPVVLGPPRENYEEYLPAHSFIHVEDFENPQQLAEHLKLLDQNQTLYEEYFVWRKQYIAIGYSFGQEHACRICDHLKRHKTFRIFRNVDKWYFS